MAMLRFAAHTVCGPKTMWCAMAKDATPAKPKRVAILRPARTMEHVLAGTVPAAKCAGCGVEAKMF